MSAKQGGRDYRFYIVSGMILTSPGIEITTLKTDRTDRFSYQMKKNNIENHLKVGDTTASSLRQLSLPSRQSTVLQCTSIPWFTSSLTETTSAWASVSL